MNAGRAGEDGNRARSLDRSTLSSRRDFSKQHGIHLLDLGLSLPSVSPVQPRSFSLQSLICWLVLGIVLFMVVYPAGVIIFSSFEIPREKLGSGFGLQAWRIAFSD